jgi:hypothetical protein
MGIHRLTAASHRKQPRHRRLRWLAAAATLVALLAITPPALANDASGPDAPATDSTSTGAGSAAPGDDGPIRTVVPNLPCSECNPGPGQNWRICDISMSHGVTRGTDERGAYSKVSFLATVSCRGADIHLVPVLFTGRTMLIDRTEGINENILVNGTQAFDFPLRHNNSLTSTGEIRLHDADYPIGNDVEVALEGTFKTGGIPWDSCQGGQWQLHFCEITGSVLHGRWGTGSFPSQIRPPCATTDPPQPNPDEVVFEIDCGALAGAGAAPEGGADAVPSRLFPRIICTPRLDPPKKDVGGVTVEGRILCTSRMVQLVLTVTLTGPGGNTRTSGPISAPNRNVVEAKTPPLPCVSGQVYTATATATMVPPVGYRPPIVTKPVTVPPAIILNCP